MDSPLSVTALPWIQMRLTGMPHQVALQALDRMGVSAFHTNFVPNSVFLHTSREHFAHLKAHHKELACLHYVPLTSDIVTIDDQMMRNFIQAVGRPDERISPLLYTAFLDRGGRKVRITEGDFAGVEGVIKRIKKDRCVVVSIRGIAAVALQVPFDQLEFI